MALDQEAKQKALFHLCYPATSLIVGNVNFNSVVRDRLAITDEFVCETLENQLIELDVAHACIKKAKDCLKVIRVDDITMNENHLRNALSEYRRLQKEFSCSVDLPLLRKGGGVRI